MVNHRVHGGIAEETEKIKVMACYFLNAEWRKALRKVREKRGFESAEKKGALLVLKQTRLSINSGLKL